MAKVTGVVEVVQNPNKWGKFSMAINGNWYNITPDWLPVKPDVGDEIAFDDGGKNYIKALSIITKGSGAPARTGGSSSKPAGKTWSNLGVELGHASNIAKDIALKAHGEKAGSEEFYKFWILHTEKVFLTMKALRKKYEELENDSVKPEEYKDSDSTVLTMKKPSSTVIDTSVEDIFK